MPGGSAPASSAKDLDQESHGGKSGEVVTNSCLVAPYILKGGEAMKKLVIREAEAVKVTSAAIYSWPPPC